MSGGIRRWLCAPPQAASSWKPAVHLFKRPGLCLQQKGSKRAAGEGRQKSRSPRSCTTVQFPHTHYLTANEEISKSRLCQVCWNEVRTCTRNLAAAAVRANEKCVKVARDVTQNQATAYLCYLVYAVNLSNPSPCC